MFIVLSYISKCAESCLTRGRWPLQAAEALQFIHSKNVIHGDLGIHNFLVQDDGSLALADFGGSKIDTLLPVVSYPTRYARPGADGMDSTEADDIFALGTMIYEITVGQQLYADKSSLEIQRCLHRHDFPDMRELPPGTSHAIRKCWLAEYVTTEEVVHDLEATVLRTTVGYC